MTDTIDASTEQDDVLSDLRAWLDANWDADLTVAEWWDRLGLAGWAAPTLPTNAYGKGVPRSVGVQVIHEINARGALGGPGGLGVLLAAPTIADHGRQEQIDHFVRDIVTGQQSWCQLFSEPGAGSDLAGLTTKATRDGDEWIIEGQKVWTSLGDTADLGMLIARTDPSVPKHQGITYFAIDMHQPQIEVRPLREMTGHAMFNETFLTEATVPNNAIIGELGGGWAVTNSTLGHERAGLGSGGGGAQSLALPGTIAGNLERRAGDFVAGGGDKKPKAGVRRNGASRQGGSAQLLIGLAKGNGTNTDPVIRQGLAKLHTLGEIGRYNAERMKSVRAAGSDIPGMANISKLSMSMIMAMQRDLGAQIVGPQAMLHAYDHADQQALDDATANPFLAAVTTTILYAQAPSIYGGTDQIQRNIIGERALGLPKEPGPAKTTPFSELPKNA
jgi:alkylation response protein AidB-like acyl-CoA dehydrogenase